MPAPTRAHLLARLAELEKVEVERIHLLQELHVHRAELEQQNEDLRLAQAELEESRNRFADLFDFAPVGYLVLDAGGRIVEANLTACAVLETERQRLLGTSLSHYCVDSAQGRLHELLRQALASRESTHCVQPLRRQDAEGARLVSLDCRAEAVPGANRAVRLRVTLSDVTEVQRNATTLRLQAEILASLDEAVNLVSLSDQRILYVNPRCEAMFGYAPGELIGRPVTVLNAGDEPTAQASADAIIRALQESGRWHGELHSRRKDGTTFWTLATVRSVAMEGMGTVLVSAQTDISARKRHEEDLSRKRNLLDSVLRVTDVMLVLLDPQFNFLWVNDAYAAICHMTPEQMVGRNHFALYPHAENEAIFRRVRDSGVGVFYRDKPFTFSGQPERGTTYWDWSLEPVKDARGKVSGLVFSLRETTQFKRTELALRESEALFATVFQSSAMGNVISRLEDGRIIEVNRAFEDLVGYTRAELVGRTSTELGLWGDPGQRPNLQAKRAEGVQLRDVEVKIRRKSGEARVALVNFNAIDLKGERCLVSTVSDISERRRRESEMAHLNRTLLALSRSRWAMLHVESEQELLGQVCRIIVEDCGYALVWIGFAGDDADKSVRLAAHAGEDDGYLTTLRITWADSERGRGPTGRAIREGKPAFCRDMEADPQFSPWREEARKHGFVASAAFPLLDAGHAFGAITIYSRKHEAFADAETKLLTDLVYDLAFGIRTLRLRTAHALAEQSLARRTSELEALVDTMPAMVFVKDAEFRFLTMNRAARQVMSIQTSQIKGLRNADLLPPSLAAAADESDRRVLATGKPMEDVEYSWQDPTGAMRWISVSKTPFFDRKGQFAGLVGVSVDISERKQEEARRLAAMGRQRDALVREVHHRIKNHLQGVMGLLRQRRDRQPQLGAALEEAIAQIGVIAEVYGMQAGQAQGPIDLSELIMAVARSHAGPLLLEPAAERSARGTWLEAEEAMPIAIVLNELLTNACKHLRAPDPACPVRIETQRRNDGLLVRVRSGPASLPDGFDFAANRGLGTGLELVRTLLPPAGAHLSYRQEGEEVVSELLLSEPVLARQ